MVPWILSVFQYRPGGRRLGPTAMNRGCSPSQCLTRPAGGMQGMRAWTDSRTTLSGARGASWVVSALWYDTFTALLTYVNATTHYCIHHRGGGGGVEVGSARSGQRPIFHLCRGLSVAGDSPRLGCTQVLAKCSHPELNPKRTSTLCPARSSAGVWQRLARLSESHSVLPRG